MNACCHIFSRKFRKMRACFQCFSAKPNSSRKFLQAIRTHEKKFGLGVYVHTALAT